MSMRCEVVAVGTELLLGQVVDTNSSFIGEQLALAGLDSHYQTKVGDNLARIVGCLRLALERSDAVIVCGGLGPTHDDITREAIAEVMGTTLARDEEVAAALRASFTARARQFPENNLRQAMVPVGGSVIPNPRGTAPGLRCPVGDKIVYAVPGVPHEMREMITGIVLPELRARSGETAAIVSRTLRTWGDSESGLNEKLDPLIERLDAAGNPTLAFLASGMEGIKVRLTAKAATEADARALLAGEEAEVAAIVGANLFGYDDDTMESVVLDALRKRQMTLAVAESVTGGLVAKRLTDVAGASEVFRGGIVSYASDVKFAVLGVPEGPVVSAEAAKAMAAGVRKLMGADVGLALTGVAGPAQQESRPVGSLFVGLAIGEREPTATAFQLPGMRDVMRELSVISALNLLRLQLL